MQFGKTQCVITSEIFDYLSDKYNVSLKVNEIKVTPFGDFYIQDLLINDHHKDTLIYAENLKGTLFDLHKIKNKTLLFKNLDVSNVWVNDKTYKGEEKSSLSVFSSSFKPKQKNKKPLKFVFKNITSNNLRYLKNKQTRTIVDFYEISGHIKELNLKGLEIFVLTDSLSFKDVYGIHYNKLKTRFNYSLKEMSFEDTHILTDESNLVLDLKFKYKSNDYIDFVNKVNLEACLDKSVLSLKDIHKIYPHFKSNNSKYYISSKLKGTLNNLRLEDAEIIAEDHSAFIIGDFELKNSIEKRENFNFKGTHANLEFLTASLINLVPDQYHKSLPQKYHGLKQLNYNGDLFVSKSKLILKGEAVTNLGKVKVDGFLDDLNTENKKINLKIPYGLIFENKDLKGLKSIAFKGDVKAEVERGNLKLNTDIFFNNIKYKKISLSNSRLNLELLDKDIKASFNSKDSLLSFSGNLAFKNSVLNKKEYDLDFEITKAKLAKLFPKNISYQKNVTAKGKLIIEQNKSSVSAKGLVHHLTINTKQDSLKLNEVDLSFWSIGKQKSIELNSKDLLDINVKGEFEFSDFEKLVENALYKFIPGTKSRSEVKSQTLRFGMKVYPKFIQSLTNKITLKDNVKLSGVLDAEGDKGVIYVSAPAFSSKDIEVDSLNVVLDNSNKWINSNISIHQFKYKKQIYEDLSLLGKKLNDTLFVRSNFSSNKIKNRAVFYLTTQDDAINLGIENIYFKYLNSIWINNEERDNKVYYNYKTGFWSFKNVSFKNGDQEFDFEGEIKKGKSKNLRLALKNINLTEALPGIDSLKIGGIASGEVFFKEKNTLLKPNGNLIVKDLKLNGVDYGLMKTSIEPSNKKLGYNVAFDITSKRVQNISAKGEIIVNENSFLKSNISLNVFLNNLKLKSLSPLGRNVLSTIRGQANGSFRIAGVLNNFDTYGLIALDKAGLKFPYINTDYNFADNTKIRLEGKTFVFEKVALKDELFKTSGVLSGEINYDKYNNWNLNLRVDTNNLLVMNTFPQENSKYYGTGFMQGFATIKGPTSNLSINVTGKTLKNTKFVLPISDVKEIEKNRFVYFKEHHKITDDDKNTTKELKGGITVLLNLDITKDALGEVVIDQTSGSSLQGRVDGRLLIDIDKYFNIKMYGDLVVDEGLYNFKYGGLINKPFIVKKGGTVSWNGDPYKADLNIEALHSVKANPKVLLENIAVNRKIDIDLTTKVTGELFDSKQEFMIDIPNASSNITSELDFKLNIDENSKMRQFFSLLVSKNFFDENGTNNTSSVFSNTTSDLISNAITDIFNNENEKFQINLGYTSGETSDVEDLSIDNQIDIGLETEINDRVLINGKLGVPVGARTQSAVVGEVKIEFLINKQGTLRTSVFNRQNEIQYSQEEQGYTQGLGLNYQIDFNSLTEMLQKLKLKSKKNKK